MEGVRDGGAVDDCFVCALLWPGTDPCPRCAGAMHWRPASLASDDALDARITAATAAWRAAPSRATLEALLELLHAGAAPLPAELALDDLRRAWTQVAPEHAPP